MYSFEERIKKLSTKQKSLLAKQISAKNTKNESKTANENQHLVAYFISNKKLEKHDLAAFLKDKLPNYMIPSTFVQVDEFPKLPNGKIDLNSLNFADEKATNDDLPNANYQKTEVEEKLIKIWEEVLRIEPIGINDNFFEIGGDSILSIQIVAKARQKGIYLAPNQIFENQTISELALFAKTDIEKTEEEEKIFGEVPLLPIQHWFFEEHKNAPNHWNQAIIFDVPKGFNANIFQKSIEKLIDHHDALRLNFYKNEDEWKAKIRETNDVCVFERIDLTNLPEDRKSKEIESKTKKLQSQFDLSESTLFKPVFFDYGNNHNCKLLLLAHHLVVDNISWQIIIEDLESIYKDLEKSNSLSLSPKTSSYKKWGEHLTNLSKSETLNDELEFWNAQNLDYEDFPTDHEKKLPYQIESVVFRESIINEKTTKHLLKEANKTYNTKTEELIIIALTLGLKKWRDIENVSFGLEKHGRRQGGNNLDLSRTVGWFTTYFPVNLKVEDSKDFKSNIISIKEKLRSVPNEGLNYGILRYLKREDSLNQKPFVLFNYLGIQSFLESDILGKGEFLFDETYSPKSEQYSLIGVNAFIKEEKLHSIFDFSKTLYNENTIKKLIGYYEESLTDLIRHCLAQESNNYTPSDFAEADLNQEDLDNLLSQLS